MEEVTVCSYHDLANLGYTYQSIMECIVEMDTNNGLNEGDTENVNRLTAVFGATTDMWRVLLCKGKIIGYWNCVILNKKTQQKLEKSKFKEELIHIRNLEKRFKDDAFDVLFDSVCLDKPYQGRKLSGLIYSSMYHTLNAISEKIPLNKIWASVWSDDGIRFSEKMGLSFYSENKYTGHIYCAPFNTFMQCLKQIIEKLE